MNLYGWMCVLQLNSRVVVCVRLLEAVCAGSPRAAGVGARRIVPALLAATRSPLCAPLLAPAFLRLRAALLPAHRAALTDTVQRVTLR